MLQMKVLSVVVLFFVVLGMVGAETYEQAVERHNREIKDIETLRWLCDWGLFILLVIVFINVMVNGSRMDKYQSQLKQQSTLITQHTEMVTKIESLSQQNLDLINRHEELIKLLLNRMGTQAPTQNVVVQQPPKQLPKPATQVVEFNPSSQADQSWLAAQRKKKQG